MEVNPWEIMFAGIAKRDLNRVKTRRSLSEMSLIGLWGPFCSLLVGWLVVRLFMWLTDLICSMPWNVLNRRCSTGVTQYSLWWKNSWPRWKVGGWRTLDMVLFWPPLPWKRYHWCSRSILHLVYLYWLNHVCRDGLTICLGMLVSLRFPFMIPSSGGLIVRRWFIPSIHMLVWTSGVTQISYCRLANSGVPLVNSLTMFMFIVSLL